MSFFTVQEQMPAGNGFALFHGQHVAILLLIGGVLACGVWRYRKSMHRNAWRWGIVMTLCLLEVLKQVVLLTTHQFGKQYLPFDLCGISILFCLLEIWKPCAYFGELLYSLSLPGTLLALFFPNWNRLPLWNFFCIHSFLFHTLLLLLPVLLLADGMLQPNWKRLPLSFLTLAGCSVVVAWLNRLWGTNFFFLSQPSKGSPLVWFADWFGASLYWIGFPILIVIIWVLLYVPIEIFQHIKQKSRSCS